MKEAILTRLHEETACLSFRRVDRTGKGLYISRADPEDRTALTALGWIIEDVGSVLRLSPGIAQLHCLRVLIPDDTRFASLPDDPDILPLLTRLLRLLEQPQPDPTLNKLIRQTMAVAQRRHAGGGLGLCLALYKEVSPCCFTGSDIPASR